MIRWFAAHPTAANLLLILVLAVGLFAVPQLTRETFPDYRSHEVGVQVEYRGASAADVEDAVCRRLHDAVRSVDFLEEFICVAQDNLADATATMDDGGDAARFLNDIRTEVEALSDLPAQAERPVIRRLHRTDLVAAVAVGGDMRLAHLEAYATRLENRLAALDGVADITTRGLSQRQWHVELSQDALAQYGLSATALAARLGAQNVDRPLGILETADRDVLLRFTDQRRSLSALRDMVVVSGEGGAELTLGEIATVTEGVEFDEEKVLFNGERALILEVHKSLRADALNVMAAMQTLLQEERTRLDDAVHLTVTQDMTSIVRDRLRMLVVNGGLGLALVLVVMSLFFRPRLAVWATVGLPVAFLGAFAVMAATGLSLNMITLVALLMAIGIVMDDAIVITDSVVARAQGGAGALDAAVDGTRQVLPGVMSSFLTTVAVFGPLSFLTGEMGAVLKVLPVVLIAAIAASLAEAFLVLPHHLKGAVAHDAPGGGSRFRRGFSAGFDAFRERVGRLTDGAIRFRYPVLGGVLVILLGSGGYMAGGHMGVEAMPDIDGDVLEARIVMPSGTPLARTEAVAARVTSAMERLNRRLSPDQPDGLELVRNLQVRFNHDPGTGERGPHVAVVVADLLTAELRRVDLETLTGHWRREIGTVSGIHSLVIQEPGFGPAGKPIEVRLLGENLESLQSAARTVSTELSGYTGVYDILDDLRPGKPQRRLMLAEGALGMGLTAADVATQLRSAILGEIADTLRIDAHDVEILVRHAEQDRASLDALSEMTVSLPDGTRVPLGTVTRTEDVREWARITRIDGPRAVTVDASVRTGVANAQAIVGDLRRRWLPEFREDYPDIDVQFEGQVARSAETGASVRLALLAGLIGVFVILSFQFGNYREPLLVMLSIPLAFVGALWGHVLMDYHLSLPSLVGAASLAGIVVNNAILLIHFVHRNRADGMPAAEAAGQAGRDRLRAILVSSGTTIAGLMPLLAETSTQATAIKPLVISVVFGLGVATLLVLFVIPALYVILEDLRGDHQT